MLVSKVVLPIASLLWILCTELCVTFVILKNSTDLKIAEKLY